MSTNRISATFKKLKKDGKKAFVVYLTAGDPHLDATVDIVCGMAEQGVDIIELGVPFTDPMADGAANQAAAERALAAGTTMQGVLDAVRRIRERSQIPILFFTYLNPMLAYGLEDFARDAVAAGVDGILPLDLPPEEDLDVIKTFRAAGLANICLVAPNTVGKRRSYLAKQSRGFVYYVCRYGVTGERAELPADLGDQVENLRSLSSVPVCVGFGISTPEQAAEVAAYGDGVIVGSHLVGIIAANQGEPDVVAKVVSRAAELATAVHSV